MRVRRLRLGIYSFNSCEGCRHELLKSWEEFVGKLSSLGIEVFREPLLGIDRGDEVDIALVEGSVSEGDAWKLVEIRKRCRYLVALGTCAISGYPPAEPPGEGLLPIDRVVRVDAWIRGCPVNLEDVVATLSWLALDAPPRRARFEWVPRRYVNISSPLLELRGDKCIVCGRCIEACKAVGLSILNYAFRGIDTVVTTPFTEPFNKHGCVSCGACMHVCPAGAIVPRVKFEVGREVWIDVDALALLTAYLELSPRFAISILRELGASRVVVWSSSSTYRGSGSILLPSPAEEEALRLYAPQLLSEVGNYLEPPSGTLISTCLSWASRARSFALATWVAKLAKPLAESLGECLEPSEPDEVVVGEAYLRAKHVRVSIEDLKLLPRNGLVAIYICPFKCSVAGIALGLDPADVDKARELIVHEILLEAHR